MSFLHGSRLSKHLAPKSDNKPLVSAKTASNNDQQPQTNNGNYGLKPMSHEPAPTHKA